MVNDPAYERSATNPPDQLGQYATAHAIIRIGFATSNWSVPIIFALTCSLKPLVKRIDARILADRVSCRFVAHARLLFVGNS